MGFTVALTGGIGSGKSTVAHMFANLDIGVVDADVIARQVVRPGEPALAQIVQHFGHNVLSAEGILNRRWLRERIFTHAEDKHWLNALLHPLIAQHTRQQLAQINSPYALWVVPLLLETRCQQAVNRILLVDVPEEIQIQRTMARDGISRQQVVNILTSQASRQQRLALADDIIDNTASPHAVWTQVNSLHHNYLQLARQTVSKELP